MFGARLTELRKQKKLTQTDVTNAFGITRTTYSSYERGRRTPDIDIQNKIANYFDISLDCLHGRESFKDTSLSGKQLTVATHIDDDVSNTEVNEILPFIDYIGRHDHK